jgi:transposase
MSNPLFLGVDVHRKTNTIAVMDQQGEALMPPFTIDNNQPGVVDLINRLTPVLADGDFDALQAASEATGWYWFHFFQSLSQDPFLNQWPLALYAFNPRLTANFKKSYVDLDHTDTIDASVIADRLRWGRDLPAPFQADNIYLPLRFLTRHRYHVVHNLAREKTYWLALLYLKASEYTHPDKRPFANIFGATSRAVLQEFTTIEEVAALPFADLVEFIDRKGKRRFPDPTENARKLRQVAQDSYPLPEALQAPIHLILGLSLKHITALEAQQKRLDTAIADQLAAIPHTLDTIPGFGPVFSAGIISEIAGVERFGGDQAKVAKFAGLKWRQTQSADFQAEDTRLTRTGNRFLRYYLCEAANAVRMRDAEYAAYYERKYHEVPKHKHKRAIVLTARKLVRLVVRLLTTNQVYRPRRP